MCYDIQVTRGDHIGDSSMNDKFFDLKKDKQDRIMNAALQVFALNGYRHASTDDIVKIASISKGLLFHYFESKLGLYAFLYEYSSRFMLLEFSREIKETDSDLFLLMKKMETGRMRVLKMYPYMRRFLDMAGKEEWQPAVEAVAEAHKTYEDKIKNYLGQADYSALAPKASREKVIKSVEYTLKGLTEDFSSRADFKPENLEREIDSYLQMFASVFQ